MQIDIKKVKETNAFSCLECGKCTGICPVARYSNTFSPRLLLIRSIRNSNTEILKTPDLWSCLTCRRCDEICPSNIHYIELVQLMRETVGINYDDCNCSHGGILQTISKLMTSSELKQNRLDWVTKDFKTSNTGEYLYFVGCLPYFEVIFSENGSRPLNVGRSTLKILNHFDVTPQLLENEKCCGHDFFWNGDISTFNELATANIQQIKKSGAKKIITSCPECYRTLKVEYPRFFGKQEYEVSHISEFLSEKLEKNGKKIKTGKHTVTFQDPCRLGRHLGVYDAPRNVIGYLEGYDMKEMGRNSKGAVCCGVSGWMNCSKVSKQIQVQRLREAKSSGADTLVTACTKCMIHFQCAMTDSGLNSEIDMEIKDLTEVFAESITS